jgi:hypothetical protein
LAAGRETDNHKEHKDHKDHIAEQANEREEIGREKSAKGARRESDLLLRLLRFFAAMLSLAIRMNCESAADCNPTGVWRV